MNTANLPYKTWDQREKKTDTEYSEKIEFHQNKIKILEKSMEKLKTLEKRIGYNRESADHTQTRMDKATAYIEKITYGVGE